MIIPVNLDEKYDVIVENGALDDAEKHFNLNRKVLVLTDDGVPETYAEKVAKKCETPVVVTLKHGEESKNFDNFKHILSVMLENSFSRKDCVVAVGGGVVGDIGGFAASCYMRGVDFYNVPTTLLSMVDSSIGGKTAIDFMGVKNVVGSFYQPKEVVVDPRVLSTLDDRQFYAGLAESIKMARVLEIMKEAARSPIEKPIRSMGGLIGGEAQKLAQHSASGQGLCGELLEKAITYAMATLETNASMGLIVASPTAGSAGIVPGLLLAFQEVYHFSDKEIQQILFNAGAVGYLAMRNATVAGAVGGCQAEVGVASAMAASAAVELMGGTPKQCLDAASTVLMNMLGLVCDPVGGLVEYPCQNRNAAGVANALIAAEMSLAGISQLIPFDEMLEAMYKVGKRLPVELRETALSGCATTPSACEACHIHA